MVLRHIKEKSYDLRKHQKEFSTVGEMKTYFVILRSAKYGILW